MQKWPVFLHSFWQEGKHKWSKLKKKKTVFYFWDKYVTCEVWAFTDQTSKSTAIPTNFFQRLILPNFHNPGGTPGDKNGSCACLRRCWLYPGGIGGYNWRGYTLSQPFRTYCPYFGPKSLKNANFCYLCIFENLQFFDKKCQKRCFWPFLHFLKIFENF